MSFYYQKLNTFEKTAYKSILWGIEKIKPSINILGVSMPSLTKIMNAILMDNPNIFYVKDYQLSSNGIEQYITPQYLYSKEDIIDLISRIENRIKPIVQNIRGNDYQKVLLIHDYICRNVKYLDVGYRTSHTCVGPALNNEGVCEGFAKFFKILCDGIDIDCVIVKGQAKSSFNNNHHLENHAWNKVYINNSWFNVDVTFDTTLGLSGITRHDYFLTSDNAINNSHYECDNIFFVASSEAYDLTVK